jgi:hypothetical protein
MKWPRLYVGFCDILSSARERNGSDGSSACQHLESRRGKFAMTGKLISSGGLEPGPVCTRIVQVAISVGMSFRRFIGLTNSSRGRVENIGPPFAWSVRELLGAA